jgi:hypothetical protein
MNHNRHFGQNQRPQPASTPVTPAAPSNDTPVQQIIAIVAKACPAYDETGATVMTHSLGTMAEAVTQALAAGKTVQQIASAIIGIVSGYATVNVPAGIGGPGGTSYELGWNIGGQEYGYADLLYALGQTKTTAGTSKPAMDAASAKALAGNGANVWEANHGAGFNAVDGHIVSVGDADYAAQVAALNAAFPPVADAPALAPVDPGTGPFGSPGIG